MNKPLAAAIFALSAVTSAHASLPTIPLDCGNAHGAVAVRRHFDAASGSSRDSGGLYDVNVTFAGKRPSDVRVEAALRACMAEAVRRDATTDAMASAWLKARRGASDQDDEQLNPFGPMQALVYAAATKTVSVRGPEPKKLAP